MKAHGGSDVTGVKQQCSKMKHWLAVEVPAVGESEGKDGLGRGE